MWGSDRLTASVATAALLVGACSDGASNGDAASTEPSGTDRLVVLVTDLSADDLLAAELIGDKIDLVLVDPDEGGCSLDAFVGIEATCDVGELTQAAMQTSGPVVVIAAGSLQRIGQLDVALLERPDVFTATMVDTDIATTVSSVTIVSVGLGDEIAATAEEATGRRPSADEIPAVVAALIAIDDTIATFEVVDTVAGAQRSTTGINLGRVESLLGTGGAVLEEASAVDTTNLAAPELLWRVETQQVGIIASVHSRSAAVGESLLMLGFDGLFRSVDRVTGAIKWTTDLSESTPATYASIVAANPEVVVTTLSPGVPQGPDRKDLVALDPTTGDELWRMEFDGEGFAGHPLLADGAAFFWSYPSEDESAFLAVDAVSGEIRWRTEAPAGLGQALFHDGVVYVGSREGTLYGFDATSGAVVFEFSSPGSVVGFGVASRPATADGILYFGGDDGLFHAVDIATGEQLWDFDVGRLNLPSSPVVAGKLVIFGGFDNAVHALDRQTGEPAWRTSTDRPVLSSPALLGDSVVVVGTGSQLDGIDVASGAMLWRHEAQDGIIDSPLVVDDVVYVQGIGGLDAIRPPGAG